MLREGYVDDIFAHERYGECAVTGDHNHCTDGEILALRCKEIDEGLRKGHLHFGDKWVSDLPVVPPDCHNIRGIDNEQTVEHDCHQSTSALGYRIHLGQGQPIGGSILWRVNRQNSLNIEPKLRGARPDWSQLCTTGDTKKYVHEHGITRQSLLSLCSNLFDPLGLATPSLATQRMLFRKVTLEQGNTLAWKSVIPASYHDLITDLAEDLLNVAQK